jgi:hypothetical protein
MFFATLTSASNMPPQLVQTMRDRLVYNLCLDRKISERERRDATLYSSMSAGLYYRRETPWSQQPRDCAVSLYNMRFVA